MTEIPSKDEELRDIGHNMSVVLDAKIILRGNMGMMNCFCGMVTNERQSGPFSVRSIVRDPHHRESPTRREQDLNLRRT